MNNYFYRVVLHTIDDMNEVEVFLRVQKKFGGVHTCIKHINSEIHDIDGDVVFGCSVGYYITHIYDISDTLNHQIVYSPDMMRIELYSANRRLSKYQVFCPVTGKIVSSEGYHPPKNLNHLDLRNQLENVVKFREKMGRQQFFAPSEPKYVQVFNECVIIADNNTTTVLS
jgi:hypothetical protein